MSKYFKSREMEGERPFKCYVCKKILLTNIEGEYTIKLNCSRCKTKITLECVDPVPSVLAVKNGELVNL